MSDLIMSMSGMRGVIGDTLDPHIAMNMALAFGKYVGKGPVIVGGDTRVSYHIVQKAAISGLLAAGTDVIDIGHVLTPTVQQMIRHFKAKGGLVISASHNPIQWNGIKVMSGSGSFLMPEEYDKYQSIYAENIPKLANWQNIGHYSTVENALELHVDHILSAIDVSSIRQSNLNVLIDPNNGAGALGNPILFDKLGIRYKMINAEPNGRFQHDPEPLKENLSQIMHALKSGDYDIGFVQDADADRLVILDENGIFIGEDYSLGYCVDYILSQKESATPHVVVNLSTSRVIKDIANKHNASISYTKIGEPNVTQGLKQKQGVVGGEGNGGVIYPKVGWGRDSLVGMVIALKHLVESGKKVSETVSTYPKYVMIRDKYPVKTRGDVLPFLKKIQQHYSQASIDTQDGIKVTFEDSWVHVRPSNTESIVRIFVEAPSEEKGRALLKEVKQVGLS